MTAEQIQADFRRALQSSVYNKELTVPEIPDAGLLERIGAKNSKNYKEILTKREVANKLESENKLTRALIAMESRFPNYRIIDMKSIIPLMKKYNLCFGEMQHYVEEIPELNQQEIVQYLNKTADKYIHNSYEDIEHLLLRRPKRKGTTNPTLYIVAPRNFFASNLTCIKNFLVDIHKPKFTYEWKFEMPTDPIVLAPLNIETPHTNSYFHIVSAWDLGADDEKVTQQIKPTNSNN